MGAAGKARAVAVAAMVAVALLFAWTLPRLKFTTAITHFLPKVARNDTEGARRSEAIASALADGAAAQTLIVDVSTSQPQLPAVAARFYSYLQTHKSVRMVVSAASEAEHTRIAEFLTKQAPWTFTAPEAFEDPQLHARLVKLQDRLAMPQGAIYSRAAPHDPLGGIWDVVAALESMRDPATTARDGILYSADERHAFFFVTTHASSFDAPAQRVFLTQVRTWARSQPEAPDLTFAGAAPFAVASEAQIQHDIQYIGTWSTLGILALFALLFRSLRLIVLALIPMAAGCVGGLLACHYIYGSVHGITVAFGTSLLGVGIDYAEHYYAHFALSPEEGPFRAMRHVWRSIALGGFTTILGLAGLFFSGSQGLVEMAVFSAASVATAFAATVWLVPPFMPRVYKKPGVLAVLYQRARSVVRFMVLLGGSNAARWSLAGVLVVLVMAGLARIRLTDEVDLLMDQKGAHVGEDRAVRARLESRPSDAVAIVTGDEDTLGERVAELTRELDAATKHNALETFPRVNALLPSPRRQDEARARAVANKDVTRAVMTTLGYEPDAFAPYWNALATEGRTFSIKDLMASPLGNIVRLEEKTGPSGTKEFTMLVPLRGVKDVQALQSEVKSAYIVEPRREIVTVFARVRTQITTATLGGLVAIFVVLALRYRSVRLGLAASLPAILAAGLTVAIFALLGIALNILHLVALLLVLGMGVDYGVFLVDKTQSTTDAARSLVSILTASLTTILSFGLLAWSANPGLSALGSTVAIGVLLSLVLSPLAIAAFRVELKDERAGAE